MVRVVSVLVCVVCHIVESMHWLQLSFAADKVLAEVLREIRRLKCAQSCKAGF